MPSHLSDHLSEGKQVPGILVFRRKATVKEILEDLVLIAKVADVDEFRDQIVHIPLK
jgi:hypothetical protein